MKKVFFILFIILLSGCDNQKEKDVVFSLNNGIDIISVGEPHIDTGSTISIDEEEFDMLVTNNNVNVDIIGEYMITYSFTSDDEKTYNYTRFVKVIDDIRPEVTLNPGIDTIRMNEVFLDSGVSYKDNYDTNLEVLVRGSVNTSILGRYVITYIVTDNSGNSREVERIVTVVN